MLSSKSCFLVSRESTLDCLAAVYYHLRTETCHFHCPFLTLQTFSVDPAILARECGSQLRSVSCPTGPAATEQSADAIPNGYASGGNKADHHAVEWAQ